MRLQNQISSSVVEKKREKDLCAYFISIRYWKMTYIIHMKIFLHLIILLWVHFIIIIILKQKSMERIFYFEFYR